MDAKALCPTPLFNKSNFPKFLHGDLERESDGRFLMLESIAFPGTLFKVLEQEGNVLTVQTQEYPYLDRLYLDRRHVELNAAMPREIELPSQDTIISELVKRERNPYIWGGNFYQGIDSLTRYYPSQDKLLCFAGVDCSGLIYEVTRGYVPRNSTGMLNFGRGILLDESLQPLDLIVGEGHVLIALDGEFVIESKLEWGGVHITPWEKRRKMLKDEGWHYGIRRWYPHREASSQKFSSTV